jgi:hypothetical protein
MVLRAAIAACLCGMALGAAADDEPLSTSEALHGFREELLTRWVVLDDDGTGPVYIASTSRAIDYAPGFCVRALMRLERDDTGAVESLEEQIESAIEGGRPMFSQLYSMTDSPSSCPTLPHDTFFPIESTTGTPSAEFLMLLRGFAGDRWRPSATHDVSFDDETAARCLASTQDLEVLDAAEDEATLIRRHYTIHLGGCSTGGRDFVIALRVEVVVGSERITAVASSISRTEYDCVRRGGCWPDV